jgi:hypothetical protein
MIIEIFVVSIYVVLVMIWSKLYDINEKLKK